MSELNAQEVSMNEVTSLLVEAGYEISPGGDEECIYVKDPESGLLFTCVLENNILFNTVACIELDESVVDQEFMKLLLTSDNGISTSAFQLYKADAGRVIVTLNNFCKLQGLGAEDRDDILSCLDFLNVDVLAARDLLASRL